MELKQGYRVRVIDGRTIDEQVECEECGRWAQLPKQTAVVHAKKCSHAKDGGFEVEAPRLPALNLPGAGRPAIGKGYGWSDDEVYEAHKMGLIGTSNAMNRDD